MSAGKNAISMFRRFQRASPLMRMFVYSVVSSVSTYIYVEHVRCDDHLGRFVDIFDLIFYSSFSFFSY